MDDIQNRISLIISTKGMSNAEFADAIDVQPSNISHIMSGRNKPSLDLVMKVLRRFPEVRTDWLLMGKGAMNKDFSPAEKTVTGASKQTDLFEIVEANLNESKNAVVEGQKSDQQGEIISGRREEPSEYNHNQMDRRKESNWREPGVAQRASDFVPKSGSGERKPDKIVFFYSDKSFSEYYPEAE